MSPSHVLEPTFRAIKERLKAGTWEPGARLEAVRIADELGVSMTPVRDSLNRLAGERLVELVPGDGFRVVRLTEQHFRDMLGFNETVLLQMLDQSTAIAPIPDRSLAGATHADRVAWLFTSIAHRANNSEAVDTVRSLNDKLHAARSFDGAIFTDANAELETLEICHLRSESRNLRNGLMAYHQRRRIKAGEIIRLLEQGPT